MQSYYFYHYFSLFGVEKTALWILNINSYFYAVKYHYNIMENKHLFKYWRKGINDRYDGWRVTKIDPTFAMIPYFLRTRMDSQNFFEESLSIDHIEEFIKEHREDIPNLSIMHVLMAALTRLISQRPRLNRYVMWNKIYARNHINISIAVKRSLTADGEETLIKPYFMPDATLQDVVRITREELDKTQNEGQQNGSDTMSKLLGMLPPWLMRTVVFILLQLDKVGCMPKAIHKISPWHCSIFLTNIGSIGIESIYHHLYEFGTCSMFTAMGRKSRKNIINKEGNVQEQKSIQLKFVLDERICDGYYYAASMRLLNQILANPSVLLSPPEQVIVDDGVAKKRIDL